MTTPIDVEALAEHAREHTAANAAKLARIEDAIRNGVPEALIYACLAPDFDPTSEAVVTAMRWAEEAKPGILVLDSKVGRGKSVAACQWAVRTGAKWVTASEVSLWSYANQAEQSRQWIDAPHLVIDEIGGQGSTGPMEVARLAVVLASRWARLRDTLMTTNLQRRSFAKLYDDATESDSRLNDRIVERGEWKTVTGPNRRTNPASIELGRQRLERWKQTQALVERVSEIGDGYDRDDTTSAPRLVAALGVTDEQIAAARAKLDERARAIAEDAAPFLESWERDREEARAAGRATPSLDTIIRRALVAHGADPQ